MIKEKLRLGNIVYRTIGQYNYVTDMFDFKVENKNFHFITIDDLILLREQETREVTILYEAVELNEEILLKVGFQKQYQDLPYSYVSLDILGGQITISFGKSETLNISKKQHGVVLSFGNMNLHEFQNLLVLLTGYELDVREIINIIRFKRIEELNTPNTTDIKG